MQNNIVRKYKDSCKHNAKVLADKIYDDLKKRIIPMT